MEAITNNIHFVFVGRLKDGKVMLSTLTNPNYQARLQDFQAYAQTLLMKQAVSANTADNMRFKSEQAGLSWHSFCDQNFILFGAVTHLDYPDDICSIFLR